MRKTQETFTHTHIKTYLPTTQRKSYFSYVRSAILHGGEIWAPNIYDLQRLRPNDCNTIGWICSAKLADHTPTNSLLRSFGIRKKTS